MRRFCLLIVIFVLRYSSDVSGFPAIDASAAQRQRFDIYKRQNSEFNRLQSNEIDYSGFDELNDQAPNQSAEIINQSESRLFGFKRRPCVPVYANHGSNGYGKRGRGGRGRNDGRTLYDLNFYFLGYQPNQYQVNPGTQTVSAIAAVDNNRPVVSDNHYDHYGGYYDCEPNPFYRPPFGFGSGNGAHYNDDPNRPSYLGSLGQGLFDFINGLFGYGNPNAGSGGYDTPVSSGTGAVLNDENAQKPVFEVNVPDTIAALNPNNWRPGQLVGGIQSSVNGFVQEISRYIPF
ncbi:uncharacterized protein LOC129565891 [Sitodiplosis mosellana]|uniref:uncharacterized protein LOC129565891 n=1 Tax=Sitodiplosis mosellana TaxID=263140 RepID=UPI002443894E|nr:uncharacterized protein LOC129565891 [Sitodiplosis mosellana]XP_055297184.1 uncharacterized protein LOC129565891 [Sitodiplosis mosellana]